MKSQGVRDVDVRSLILLNAIIGPKRTEVMAMSPFLPLTIGLPTAIGVGCFCLDIYRNRRRLAQKPVPAVDMTGCDPGIILDGDDLHAIGQTVNHASHAVGEVSGEYVSSGLGQCLDAIVHVIPH